MKDTLCTRAPRRIKTAENYDARTEATLKNPPTMREEVHICLKIGQRQIHARFTHLDLASRQAERFVEEGRAESTIAG